MVFACGINMIEGLKLALKHCTKYEDKMYLSFLIKVHERNTLTALRIRINKLMDNPAFVEIVEAADSLYAAHKNSVKGR